ncbi:MAG: glycosyltransferase [Clostridia bacterium]
MNNIKITVIMGIYNCSKYLEESIDSLLNQTYTNWNLVMCDDCSTDNTYDIAKKYAKKYAERIILLKNDRNMGLNYTLNKCLEKANGEYIARQDGDDISESTRFEKEEKILSQYKKYSIVSCNMQVFDDNGFWGKTNVKEKPENLDFIHGTPFCHAASMIRKEVFDIVNGYTVDSKLLRVEDYHLWFKIYQKGFIGYNIQECLYYMRDDINAAKRRNWQNRINECRVKVIGYKMLNIPKRYYIYSIRPILLGLLPQKIYLKFHKKKLGSEK